MRPMPTPPYSLPINITNLLNKCRSINHLKQAQSLLIKTNLITHPPLLTKFISLSSLSPFSNLDHALSLLLSVPHPSPHLYTLLIRAYSSSIFPIKSLYLYNHMCRHSTTPPYSLTLTFALKACSKLPIIEIVDADVVAVLALQKGSELHSRVFRAGLDRDVCIGNTLITMYSNCGAIGRARMVFDEMGERRSTVTWNAMAVGYSRLGDFDSADWVFRQTPEKDVSSWNGVITRCVRSGDVAGAWKVFEKMHDRDSVSWNSMIAGYVSARDYKSAIGMFKRMLDDEFEPTQLTMVSVLGACAETGSMEVGHEIYEYLKSRNVVIDGFVGNAVLDMFAKCGNVRMAQQVFDEMGSKHVSCWNSMIVALAVHGYCDEALELFSKMDQEPNRITFLGVLLACSHKGLVEEGREFFRKMVEEYKIKPDIKHFGCMVDMLSRVGLVNEAYKMVKSMPMKANSVIWKTLIGACKVHGAVELAEEAIQELGALGPLRDDDYTLMSNIYAEAGRWADVERLRDEMIGQSILKQTGYSQIELSSGQ